MAERATIAIIGAGRGGAALGGHLGAAGHPILVDCSNPVRWDAGPVWDPPAEGSGSAALAAASLWIHLASAGGLGRELGLELLRR